MIPEEKKKSVAAASGETKQKTCQACGQTYEYPLPQSFATRFHCEVCAGLPENVRKIFERQNRRIRDLEKALQAAVRKG